VLDGAEPADADLAATARILRDAAAAVRLDVARAEVEAALERARPAPVARRPRRRLRVAAAGLAAAAVLAAVILLALPFTSGPVDVDVQARALAALGDRGTILSVAEVVRPGPGESFPVSIRTGWIDPTGGRQRWTQSTADGTVVAETMVDRGRVTRYDPLSHTAVVAASCTALASGCADAVDPIAVYRRALASAGPLRTHARTVDGRSVYVVRLPVQRLGAVHIVQVATIDATTLLPVRIAWRELRLGGSAQTFAVIVVREITRQDASQISPGLLDLELPPGTTISQLAAPGTPVRLISSRSLSLAQARALAPRPWWLGRTYRGHPLTRIELMRYTGGTAVRVSYGRTLVWTYGRVIPPSLLGSHTPTKTIPLTGGIGRFYSTIGGVVVGERTIPAGTVAVEAPENASTYTALGKARPVG
jgi:hypothetical protein